MTPDCASRSQNNGKTCAELGLFSARMCPACLTFVRTQKVFIKEQTVEWYEDGYRYGKFLGAEGPNATVRYLGREITIPLKELNPY